MLTLAQANAAGMAMKRVYAVHRAYYDALRQSGGDADQAEEAAWHALEAWLQAATAKAEARHAAEAASL